MVPILSSREARSVPCKAVAVNAVHSSSPDAPAADNGGVLSEGDSGGVTISEQQYQTLYSLFQGHGSAAVGPALVVSCVSKNPDAGSAVPTPDAQYMPSSSQGSTQPEDAPSNSQEEEEQPELNPTKKNIKTSMKWLVKGCESRDSLVFYFSGHGVRQPDMNNDEKD
ncbi:AMC3 [Linum perenne]